MRCEYESMLRYYYVFLEVAHMDVANFASQILVLLYELAIGN
jgi:hypothetical protein